MSRKKMILQFFKTNAINSEKIGVNTTFLAEHLDLSRHNVSTDLNELVREGALKKSEGRPVKYWLENFAKKNTQHAFYQLVGYDGSLKRAVEIAKASIIYPPNGLNTIISGPSGAGKSFLADIMFQYAKEVGAISEAAPFVLFNCADYANNPQLLTSQLFGHVKGAFTGAESDSEGIIMQANQGMIFLDEVHRLPPEGQEMLFLLIDKGYFYKLGDSNTPRHVNIRIVTATSMDIESSLLVTFLRRFPTQIHLPALSERPLKEKLTMIKLYFQEEAKHLGVSLSVSPSCLVALLLFQPKGNVGELRNTIRLSCAKAFLNYISSDKIDDLVRIFLTHLPTSLQITYFEDHKNINEVERMIGYEDTIFFHESNEEKLNEPIIIKPARFETIINNYLNSGLAFNEIKKLLTSDIHSFANSLRKSYPSGKIDISPELNQFVQALESDLNCNLLSDFSLVLTVYIRHILENKSASFTHDEEVYLAFYDIPSYQAVCRHSVLLESTLEQPLSTVECITVAFFTEIFSINHSTKISPKIIVICHGESTATSLVQVANQLINYDNIQAIDMPLDISINVVYRQLVEILQNLTGDQEILLIVDMGSLKFLKERLVKEFNYRISLIDMATTLIVMEACKMAKYGNQTAIEEIAQNIAINYEIDTLNSIEKQKVILTSCLTGQGTARRLVSFLEEYLVQNNFRNMKVIAYDGDFSKTNDMNVVAVVGTINPHYESVPFIGIEKFFLEDGKKIISDILSNTLGKMSEYDFNSQKTSSLEAEQMAKKFILESIHEQYRIPIIDHAFKTYNDLKDTMSITFSPSQIARYIIHYSFCLERLIQKEPIAECPELANIKTWHKELFTKVSEVSKRNLPEEIAEIPEEELGYIVQIFL